MMDTLIGLSIFAFIFYMGWLVVKYVTKPDQSKKFPVLALLIFILCCGFFVVVFVLDYSGAL
jgi:hypothetical protein